MNTNTVNIDDIIKETIKSSFEILKELIKNGFSEKTKLIIPNYQNNKRKNSNSDDEIRVSEQELRFIFVEQLNKTLPEGFYYSIETPTNKKYKFSEKGKNCKPVRNVGKSGNFDLTIQAIQDEEKQIVAIVEFKSKSASPHSYAKDLCKLWNKEEGLGSDPLRYFINVFDTMEKQTQDKFVQKITNNDWFKKQPGDIDVWVVCKSLTEGQTESEFEGWDSDLKTFD